MAATLMGMRSWSMERTREGHREYKVLFLVRTNDTSDGPYTVANCTGLARPGDPWLYGNDRDLWAFCKRAMTVRTHDAKEGDPHKWWIVEQTFSTDKDKECKEDNIENPLLQPVNVSGTFVRYTEEATHDRFGVALKNSAHEQIRGPIVEFDSNRAQVRIQQNVADLQLDLLTYMLDTVNDAPLWGLPPRCIKLSNTPWERKYYGQCGVYYTRTLEFDINFKTFDRTALDEGTKVIIGDWDETTGLWELKPIDNSGTMPDKDNPLHFMRYHDKNGNPSKTILDGNGRPFSPESVSVVQPEDCTLCSSENSNLNMYNKLRVQGLVNATLVLTHTTGCNWSGTASDGEEYTLLGEEGEVENLYSALTKWTLTQTSSGIKWYNYDPAGLSTVGVWHCNSSNLMSPDMVESDNDQPEVTLVVASKPGSRVIQKYTESNFLLLGIPTIL